MIVFLWSFPVLTINFWPPSPCMDIFIPWERTKTDIFDPLFPHLVHVVNECPLKTIFTHFYPFQRVEIEFSRIIDFLFFKIITFSLGLCKLRIKLRNPNLRWLSTHQDFFFNLSQCLFKRFQIEKSLTLSCTVVLPCI